MSAKQVSLHTVNVQQARFTESIKGVIEEGVKSSEVQDAAQILSAQRVQDAEQLEATPAYVNIRLQKAAAKDTKSIERKSRVQSSVFVRPEEADELGDLFSGQEKNKDYYLEAQLLSKLAQELGKTINENTEPEQVISIVRERMTEDNKPPEAAVVDKAFEFLLFVCTKKIEKVGEEKLKFLEEGKPVDDLDHTENRIINISQKLQIAKERHLNSHRLEVNDEQNIVLAIDFGSKINELTHPDEITGMIRTRLTVNNTPPDELTVHKAFQFLIKKTKTELKSAINNKNRNEKSRISKILTKIETASRKNFELNQNAIKADQVILGAIDSVAESTDMDIEDTKRFRELAHNTPDIQTFRKGCASFGDEKAKLKKLRESTGEELKRENMETAEIPQLIKLIRLLQAFVGVHLMAQKLLKTAENFLRRNRILT